MRGEGVWVWDADGRRYLDCYNNVPTVGHCHPRVVEAIARQASTLNTHTRYLDEVVLDCADRIAALMPDGLSQVSFGCSGSEANELAIRMARAYTGAQGLIVTENAYHGTTQVTAEISTEDYPRDRLPAHVVTIPAPDPYRGPFRGREDALPGLWAEAVDDAIARLAKRGHRPAVSGQLDTLHGARHRPGHSPVQPDDHFPAAG